MLAALPPIIQVLVFNGFYDALLVLAGYLLINLVFGNILEPRIMGRGLLNLSGIFVVNFLLAEGSGGMLPPRSVNHHCQNRPRTEHHTGGQSIAVLLSDLNKR